MYQNHPVMAKLLIALATMVLTTAGYAQQGAQLYKTYCAGCHGAQLQGNSAPTLIKETWTYGRSRGALVKNVKYGIADAGMPAWKAVLEDEQIEAVVDFVVASQETPPDAPRPIPDELTTEDYTLQVEKIVTKGITKPWGITFVDESHALFTENEGRVRWLVDGTLDPQPIEGIPLTHTRGTGGLMDIIVDPDYSANGWVYLAYSHYQQNDTSEVALAMTKIVRGKIRKHRWVDEQTLFEVPDSLLLDKGNRWGCRFLFDKQGYLYFSIGDMGRGEDSQNLGSAVGKVYRIHPDGAVPPDNPFVNQPGVLPAIFSLGNRNVQGMAQDPRTGTIWATEHGPMGGDELNILKKGANYGWPVITYGIDYSGEIVSDKTHQQGMEQPVTQWTPSLAVCPLQFVDSPQFPKWKNNLLVGALAFEEVRRLVLEDQQVVKQEMILKGHGRVRDIEFSPDGSVYLLLNEPDMIVRLLPAKGP